MKDEFKTLTFRCPWCKNTCAFKDFNAGKSARCTGCQKYFIIPDSEETEVKKIKLAPLESDGDIISGFYRAALKKSGAVIFSRASAAGLVFITAMVFAKFITWNFNFQASFYIKATGKFIVIPILIGRTAGVSAYALMLWYYMEIIYNTAFGTDNFPESKLGTLYEIIGKIVKTLYLVSASITVSQLPTLLAMFIMKLTGTNIPAVTVCLAVTGFLILPMQILMAAISQDLFSILRIDLAVRAVVKVPGKYLLALAVTGMVAAVEVLSKNYSTDMLVEEPVLLTLFLIGNIFAAVAGTYAARVLGLLYKHHGGQMPW